MHGGTYRKVIRLMVNTLRSFFPELGDLLSLVEQRHRIFRKIIFSDAAGGEEEGDEWYAFDIY